MIQDIIASLLNSVWQSIILFGAVWLVTRIARRSSAATRYALWFAVLIAAIALPAIDFAIAANRSTVTFAVAAPSAGAVPIAPDHYPPLTQAHHTHRNSRPPAREVTQALIAAPAPSMGAVAASRTAEMIGTIASGVRDQAPWIFAAWSVLAGVLLFQLALSYRRLLGIKRALVPMRDHGILAMTEGSQRPVTIGVSSELTMPCLLGFARPAIALPEELVHELPAADLARIVRHEHAHVVRWDDIGNAAQQIAKSLFWLSPAIHLICRMLDIEREIACDDFAVVPLEERVQYAKCLTHLAVNAFERSRPLPAPCLFFSRKQLLIRVERMLERGHNGTTFVARRALYGLAILAVAVVAVARFQLPVIAAPPPAPVVNMTAPIVVVVPRVTVPAHVRPAVAAAAAKIATASAKAAVHAALRQLTIARPSIPATQLLTSHTFAAMHIAMKQMTLHMTTSMKRFATTPLELPTKAVAAMAIADAQAAAADAQVAATTASGESASTGDLLDALSKAGYSPLSVDDLIRLKDVGVTGDFVSAAVAYNGSRPSVDSLVRLASVGVDAGYLRDLPSLGTSHIDIESVIRMKSVGVDPAYIRDMDSAMNASPSADDIVRLRSVGVDPAYVRDMSASLGARPAVEDLIQLRSIGMDPAYVRDIYSALNSRPALDDLIRLRSVGMDPGYIRDMDLAMNERLKVDDLIRLRSVGVDADFVRAMRNKGLGGTSPLTVEELIRLRTAGI